ncbi:MAG: ATP-binding protein [Firmicutes bacterium]|nr:ATP-binding protein [Bacillota bacterium]
MLGQLRLSGARDKLEELLADALKKELTALQFTNLLLKEELFVRNANSLKKRMKRARFPEHKTLDEFDFGFQQSVSKQQLLGLMDMCWVEKAFNLFFLGPPSIGNYEKILLMERNEVVTNKISDRSFISFHNI